MKIGMLTAWNVPCGASIHAQLVGDSWIKDGHKLIVFAPYGVPILQKEDATWMN